LEAILAIKDRKGASNPAIKKYIAANFTPIKYVSAYRAALKKLIASGVVLKVGTVRYKLNEEKKKEMKKEIKKEKVEIKKAKENLKDQENQGLHNMFNQVLDKLNLKTFGNTKEMTFGNKNESKENKLNKQNDVEVKSQICDICFNDLQKSCIDCE
jgi:hypothetical protein